LITTITRATSADPHGGIGLLGAPECGDVMKLQMKINSGTQVTEEALAIKSTNIVRELSLPPCNSARCNKILEN
jgi:NifU-like protein involved in Fe-S cluster formation